MLVKAIILADCHDFGRFTLTSRLPTALWPVMGKPVLERLLTSLAEKGIKEITIYSNDDASLLAKSIQVDHRLEINFLDESLLIGTAGCIREATIKETDVLTIVFPASLVHIPKIDTLINAHQNGQADLTVVLNPDHDNGKSMGSLSGIFVYEPSILEYIPKAGYFDIKEGLIPTILRTGKTINSIMLPNNTGNFQNRQEYLNAISDYFESNCNFTLNSELKSYKGADSQTLWIAKNTRIDPGARIYGPAVIMDGVCISNEAVILGPTMVGNNVTIGKGSVVVNSALWDGVQVGSNCHIQRCILDYNVSLRDNSVLEEEFMPFEPKGMPKRLSNQAKQDTQENANRTRQVLQQLLRKIYEKMPNCMQLQRKNIPQWLAAGVVLIVFIWSYWPNLINLWSLWQRSDEYSSGLLVPFLTFYILWSRRHEIVQYRIKPSVWGLFAFIAAQVFRLFGLFFMYGSAERMSIVLTLAAMVLLLFGWQFLRKVSTILLFLCLMLPWPTRLQGAVTLPLQRWATSSAVFCLEMVGYEIVREGNIIHIDNASVAVAEACNGLRMVTAFFVISGLVVLLVKRAWWEKLIVLASSLPIALLCNTVRLTITAIFFTALEGEYWEKIFHDFGGYAMMPLALAAIVTELWLLAKLLTPPDKKEAIIIKQQEKYK